jgi:V-type H+-transporting ATPase subunit H
VFDVFGPSTKRQVNDTLTEVKSHDEDVASVACFDIGEFVRHYPNGKMIAKQLGAKDAIMKLIEHENIELQRNALNSVSKMLVQNWEAVR